MIFLQGQIYYTLYTVTVMVTFLIVFSGFAPASCCLKTPIYLMFVILSQHIVEGILDNAWAQIINCIKVGTLHNIWWSTCSLLKIKGQGHISQM